jgi:hypothetical protein
MCSSDSIFTPHLDNLETEGGGKQTILGNGGGKQAIVIALVVPFSHFGHYNPHSSSFLKCRKSSVIYQLSFPPYTLTKSTYKTWKSF